jgi:hypothetical protein
MLPSNEETTFLLQEEVSSSQQPTYGRRDRMKVQILPQEEGDRAKPVSLRVAVVDSTVSLRLKNFSLL